MRASEHAPGGPFRLLGYLNGLAEIVERGAFVIAERRRVILSHFEGAVGGELHGMPII